MTTDTKTQTTDSIQSQTEDYTYTILELKNDDNFETRFFDEKFRKAMSSANVRFENDRVPKRMTEIVQIANGKYKRTRTININLTERNGDNKFLWYIIAFVNGKVSASYNRNPFSFNTQSKEAQQRVLDTLLKITTSWNPSMPKASQRMF